MLRFTVTSKWLQLLYVCIHLSINGSSCTRRGQLYYDHVVVGTVNQVTRTVYNHNTRRRRFHVLHLAGDKPKCLTEYSSPIEEQQSGLYGSISYWRNEQSKCHFICWLFYSEESQPAPLTTYVLFDAFMDNFPLSAMTTHVSQPVHKYLWTTLCNTLQTQPSRTYRG